MSIIWCLLIPQEDTEERECMERATDIVKVFKRKPWEWIKFSRPWKKTALDNERERSA